MKSNLLKNNLQNLNNNSVNDDLWVSNDIEVLGVSK